MLTVRDIMRLKGEGIWAVSPETNTIDALRFMAEKRVGALLVLDGGLLVGIISERDFVYRIAEERDCCLERPVKDTMTSKVITVTPQQTIEQCMQLMTNRHIRHLPVIDEGNLTGIISIGDVVKGIISDQSSLINNLEDYIMGTGYGK